MTIKYTYRNLIIVMFCLIHTVIHAGEKTTATKFLSFSAGVSTSFIAGATAYQHKKFLQTYQAELTDLNYKVFSSITPRIAPTFGVKYGHPFNDKIMMFTGVDYSPRGFSEKFTISDTSGVIDDYNFRMIANYWDFYFGLKYKNTSGVTLGIGGIVMYNCKDLITIDHDAIENGKKTSTNTQHLFNEYYEIQRDIFPGAPFISIGYENQWWQIEFETSYSSNIFLATDVEMNFITAKLKASFVLLWD